MKKANSPNRSRGRKRERDSRQLRDSTNMKKDRAANLIDLMLQQKDAEVQNGSAVVQPEPVPVMKSLRLKLTSKGLANKDENFMILDNDLLSRSIQARINISEIISRLEDEFKIIVDFNRIHREGRDFTNLQLVSHLGELLDKLVQSINKEFNQCNYSDNYLAYEEYSQRKTSLNRQILIASLLIKHLKDLLFGLLNFVNDRTNISRSIDPRHAKGFAFLKTFSAKLISYMRNLKSLRLLEEMMDFLSFSLMYKFEDSSLEESLLPILKRHLNNKNHKIKSKCIMLLTLCFTKPAYRSESEKIIKILLEFLSDQDPRVRQTAVDSLILLHVNGFEINLNHYKRIIVNLNDDYFEVRILTTKLIFLLASKSPNFLLNLSDLSTANKEKDDMNQMYSNEQIRLIDDAFSRVCCMINDISLDVKICAAMLLGYMSNVSPKFLLQTLDKKLMMDLKVRKTNQQRNKQLVSSEWSAKVASTTSSSLGSSANILSTLSQPSSQFNASNVPNDGGDDDYLNLMSSSGACGAFIHGLEDEYHEVRILSEESLLNLAINCPEFAAKSIDFLVDMFNDEIESVRLKAIKSLSMITHFILLRDDQIDVILSIMEDSSFIVRESVKELLSGCKLATKIGLKKAITALFSNLKKFSMDKLSTWNCFKNLGIHHSKFVMSLIPFLVDLHPFIDVIEPDMNDLVYTSSLILIYNSACQNSAILPILPKYMINHYFFMKLQLPDLIPTIKLIDNLSISHNRLFELKLIEFYQQSQNPEMDGTVEVYNVENEKFHQHIIKTLNLLNNDFRSFNQRARNQSAESSHSANYENLLKLFKFAKSDLEYLKDLERNKLKVICEIMYIYIDNFTKLFISESSSPFSSNNFIRLFQIEEAISNNLKLFLMFNGFSMEDKFYIFRQYMYLYSFYLKELFNISAASNASVGNTGSSSALTSTSLGSSNLANIAIFNGYLKFSLLKKDLIKECNTYLSFLKMFARIFSRHFQKASSSEDTNDILMNIYANLEGFRTNPLNLLEYLNKNLSERSIIFDLLSLDKDKDYSKQWLELIEPKENTSSNPIRFTPGLICSLKIKAILHNFTHFDNLYIQIIYSDNDKMYVPIELCRIKEISPKKHVIDTEVNLCNYYWTDCTYVKVGIAMNIEDYNDIKQNLFTSSSEDSDADRAAKVADFGKNTWKKSIEIKKLNHLSNYLLLSKLVKIFFEPSSKKFI